ncbi:MAG: aminotransferase class I/II-fold pyridoxal phosphate-dependent enzyme [Candidatus Brocadiia bacterium]
MGSPRTFPAESRLAFLKEQDARHLRRTLSPVTMRRPGHLTAGGEEIVDFSSNDYLGLSRHPSLRRRALNAIKEHGSGSGASRLMSGDLDLHHELERLFAELKGKEAALLFNSGYQANVGLLQALTGRRDAIVADRLIHASIIDGAMMSRARLLRFNHNDTESLAAILGDKRSDFDNVLIVTESVFSMDGDLAPLEEICRLKDQFGCELLVDEAHATGIFGPEGAGRVEQAGLGDKVEFIMGTFSKALGGFGAAVAADRADVDYLINTARSFIYSTALPPSVVASNIAALKYCMQDKDPGKELLAEAERLREMLQDAGLTVRGKSQIIPVILGGSDRTLKVGRRLLQRGYRTVPVRPPTVPEGRARLRISLCTAHTADEINGLAEEIRDVT